MTIKLETGARERKRKKVLVPREKRSQAGSSWVHVVVFILCTRAFVSVPFQESLCLSAKYIALERERMILKIFEIFLERGKAVFRERTFVSSEID